MENKPLNNKVYFELLPDEDQPKKSLLRPDMDLLKYAKVLKVGNKVTDVYEKDIITVYVNNMYMIDLKRGFCSDRDVIFTNSIPKEGKVHIESQKKEELSLFNSADVIESNSKDIKKGDTIYYKEGSSLVLPDSTEVISETQIYYKKED